jgi:RNA polymerase sigma-70 factor (ECF subfamily)
MTKTDSPYNNDDDKKAEELLLNGNHSSHHSMVWDNEWPQSVHEFEEFVTVFHDQLYRFIYYRIQNRQDAEDILQSVFLKAFDQRKKLRKVKSKVGSYLFRMGYNACIDHLRKHKKSQVAPIEHDHVIELPTQIQTRDASIEWERIERVFLQIPKKQAEVVRLRVVDEFEFQKIAEILRIFETTARTRYRYGVQKIRKILLRENQ